MKKYFLAKKINPPFSSFAELIPSRNQFENSSSSSSESERPLNPDQLQRYNADNTRRTADDLTLIGASPNLTDIAFDSSRNLYYGFNGFGEAFAFDGDTGNADPSSGFQLPGSPAPFYLGFDVSADGSTIFALIHDVATNSESVSAFSFTPGGGTATDNGTVVADVDTRLGNLTRGFAFVGASTFVPEPSSALLLGLSGLGFLTRRKRA